MHFRFKLYSRFCLTFLLSALLVLTGCRNKDAERSFVEAVEVEQLAVQSLQIQAGLQGVILEAGTESQFRALATLRDNSQLDVTDRVRWSSSNSAIASVSGAGLVTGGATDGSTDVSVNWSDFSATQAVSVSTAALIGLSYTSFPASLSECLVGTQLSVIGNYSDRSSDVTAQITSWTSSDTSIATVDGSGLVNTLDAGSASLIASYRGLSTSQTLNVDDAISAISQTPNADFSLEQGATQAFTVAVNEGTTSRDATSIATFNVADSAMLSVSSTGIATAGNTVGTTSVSATCGGLTSTPINVTITQKSEATSLIIRYNGASSSPAGPFSPSEGPIQLQAFLRYSNGSETEVTTSEFLDWSVASTVSGTSATIDNDGSDKGEVQFNAVGRTELEAVYDDDKVYFEDSIDVLVE